MKYKVLSVKIYQILIGFILGIILNSFSIGFIVFITISIILIYFFKGKVIFLLLFMLTGMIYVSAWNNYIQNTIHTLKRDEITFTASIIEEPLVKDYTQEIVIQPIHDNIFILGEVDKYINIEKGDVITIRTDLDIPEPSPYFDRLSYLKSRKIFLEFKKAEILKIEKYNNISTFLQSFKAKVSNIIEQNLNEPQSSLAKGLIIGDDSNFTKNLKDNFKNSGLSHVTSVSGYNVGIIFIFLLYFTKFFSRKKLLLVTIILINLFWEIIGFTNLPTARATLMLSFICFGLLFGRKVSFVLALLLSTELILIYYPFYFLNISFQLSLAALIGIIILTPILTRFLERLKLRNILTDITATTTGVLIATLPISYITFGQVSIISILTNTLVLPLIPIATLLTFLQIVLELINLSFLSKITAILLEYLLKIIITIVNYFGNLNFVTISNPVLVVIFFILLTSPLFVSIYIKARSHE